MSASWVARASWGAEGHTPPRADSAWTDEIVVGESESARVAAVDAASLLNEHYASELANARVVYVQVRQEGSAERCTFLAWEDWCVEPVTGATP